MLWILYGQGSWCHEECSYNCLTATFSNNRVFTRFACCFTRNTLSIIVLLWSTRLLQKTMSFQSKTYFLFNLLLFGFDFAVLCLCVSQGTFSQFLFAYICIASYSASHQMLWHNKRIHDRNSHQRCSWPWFENYKLLSFFVILGN